MGKEIEKTNHGENHGSSSVTYWMGPHPSKEGRGSRSRHCMFSWASWHGEDEVVVEEE